MINRISHCRSMTFIKYGCSSSTKITLKNAQRWAIFIVIFSILLYTQLLYCYEANLIDTPLECYGKTIVCRYITDLSFVLITIILLLLLMILFGLLTISNVRQSQRLVQTLQLQSIMSTVNNSSGSTNGNTEQKLKQKNDRSLLRMLLVQVLLLAIFILPLSLDKFYSSFSEDNGSSVAKAINIFVYDLAILIYFISNGIPFYIYTLCGGTVFRKASYHFVVMTKRKMLCH
ncbi:unnamed protein product [Rotaria sp. Silwood2]|nr:unnamed protein product [Rotaria sp. Silwood2]CAF3035818.1 unnamed protein product [Rotaria sp. Silwood2]CAF3375161.1 unnamed protein product [Rotaria sp. Silwood2]CAF4208245.1 unnamed protein product [Rotaria sp. Silwood2]CAF4307655.1 unnamed protein product [Rotaria sp. Silwood2]